IFKINRNACSLHCTEGAVAHSVQAAKLWHCLLILSMAATRCFSGA
ncbi:unnamed protein product, partial [Ixodes persulcatus]